MKAINIKVNGELKPLHVEEHHTLLQVLREQLFLTGTKEGCGAGECGACTVLMNGKAVNSCLILAVEADGQEVTTIEGVAEKGKLSLLQDSFVKHGAIQCGFCTPGMVLAATAILAQNPNPSEVEIRQGLSGNLCRCTGYAKIVKAIRSVVDEIK